MVENKIDKIKIDKYRNLSEKALKEIKKKIVKGREIEAHEVILMAESYISDSKHFEKTGNLVNAYGALNYAHGWIDCGVRLRLFDVKDDKLFTLP